MKEALTEKQQAILAKLDEGLSVRQIAQERNVSQQAVYAQLRTMVKKGWLRKAYSANYERV